MRTPSTVKLIWEGCQILVSQRKTGTKLEGQLVKTKGGIHFISVYFTYLHASLGIFTRFLLDKNTFDLE